MGWMTYLVDKKNGLMIPVGKSDEDRFMENLEIFQRVNKKLYEIEEEQPDFYGIKDKPLKKLSVGDLQKLINYADIVSDLTCVTDNPMAYYYYLKIAEDVSGNYLDANFEIINNCADDYGKYRKKYKIVEEHQYMKYMK